MAASSSKPAGGSILMTPELFAAHHRQPNGRKYAIDLQIITVARDLAPNFERRPFLTVMPRNDDEHTFFAPRTWSSGSAQYAVPALADAKAKSAARIERARSQGQSSKLSLPIDPSAPLGVDNPQCRWPGHR